MNTYWIDDAEGAPFAKRLLRADAIRIAQKAANEARRSFFVYDFDDALDHELVTPHTAKESPSWLATASS